MNSLLRINLISVLSIFAREFRRICKLWKQTIIAPMLSSCLYLLIFGSFLGNRIGTIEGIDYVLFLVPGLIMMQVIIQAYSNVSHAFFMAKFQGFIEEILVSPTHHISIVIGYMLSGILRGLFVAVSIFIVTIFFVDIKISYFSILLYTFITSSACFSLFGLLVAIFAKSFDQMSIIPTFLITPLTYLGGVFFPISVLPEIWQSFSAFNPILYIINLFRYAFFGFCDVSVFKAIIALFIFNIILLITSMYVLKRNIR